MVYTGIRVGLPQGLSRNSHSDVEPPYLPDEPARGLGATFYLYIHVCRGEARFFFFARDSSAAGAEPIRYRSCATPALCLSTGQRAVHCQQQPRQAEGVNCLGQVAFLLHVESWKPLTVRSRSLSLKL